MIEIISDEISRENILLRKWFPINHYFLSKFSKYNICLGKVLEEKLVHGDLLGAKKQ